MGSGRGRQARGEEEKKESQGRPDVAGALRGSGRSRTDEGVNLTTLSAKEPVKGVKVRKDPKENRSSQKEREWPSERGSCFRP